MESCFERTGDSSDVAAFTLVLSKDTESYCEESQGKHSLSKAISEA